MHVMHWTSVGGVPGQIIDLGARAKDARPVTVGVDMAIEPPRLIFILGTAYCGSTLLGQCLSNRPQALFVGEIYDVYKGWRTPRCGCEFIRGEKCSFWDGFTFDETIYQQLKFALSVLIIDASKYPEWILRHARAMEDSRVIVMFKDPESFLFSWHKRGQVLDWGRHVETPATKTIEAHLKLYVQWYELAMNAGLDDRTWFLSHEAFSLDPVLSLLELHSFLGIPYRPGQEHYWEKTDNHILGSNGGVLSQIRSGKPAQETIVQNRHRHEARDEIADWERCSEVARRTYVSLVHREERQRFAALRGDEPVAG
jgi:hypothetical protein